MNSDATQRDSLNPHSRYLRLAVFGIWALGLFVFTIPGRTTGGGLDALGLAKLGVCSLLVCFTIRELWTSYFHGFESVGYTLLPTGAFLLWSAASVLWSPLPLTTISQLFGIVALVTLMLCVSMCCRTAEDFEKIFRPLCLSLFAMNCLVLVLHLVRPDLSGLDRTVEPLGADGAIHPTAAGANSSLGLLLGFTVFFVWKPRRNVLGRADSSTVDKARLMGISLRAMSVPMMIVSGLVLVFAASRTALGLAVMGVPVAWYSSASNRATGRVLIFACAGLLIWMLADPRFGVADRATASLVDAAYRGGTESQLVTLNGRTDMWAAIWEEFERAPMIGHGFGVTSEEGSFLMWRMHRNHTAHNLFLQVLVSTGVVGTLLFLWAVLKPIVESFSRRPSCHQSRQIRHTVWIVFLWYLGWSQLCITFIGPLRTESVVFFTLMGMMIANAALDRQASTVQASKVHGSNVFVSVGEEGRSL